MAFARFMASFWGRALRIVVGLALILWGLNMTPLSGAIVALIGLGALLSGVFNVCGIALLMGAPFRGRDILPE